MTNQILKLLASAWLAVFCGYWGLAAFDKFRNVVLNQDLGSIVLRIDCPRHRMAVCREAMSTAAATIAKDNQ